MTRSLFRPKFDPRLTNDAIHELSSGPDGSTFDPQNDLCKQSRLLRGQQEHRNVNGIDRVTP
jgi:hypothetical protein